jgi:YidC/Oxa1 family membrane protein insertase
MITVPLTYKTLENRVKLQRLLPLQEKIAERYANNTLEMEKVLNKLQSAVDLSPFSGLLSAFQLPVLTSLKQAIWRMILDNKLNEPFYWIPNLQGPNDHQEPDNNQYSWITSALSGKPELGWLETFGYVSVPVTSFLCQLTSRKLLSDPEVASDISLKSESPEQLVGRLIQQVLPLVFLLMDVNSPAALGTAKLRLNLSIFSDLFSHFV